MATTKYANYAVLALKRRRSQYVDYEWEEWQTFSTKVSAEKYAKEQSKIDYGKKYTGRFAVQKRVTECMYEDGKKIK